MKTFKLVTFLCIVLTIPLSAHEQVGHQHITREAFKLLQKSFPGQLADMANYIGTNETQNAYNAKSFGVGKIVSGAWIEDEYDIAYHYGIGKAPSYNQTLPNNSPLSNIVPQLITSLRLCGGKWTATW